MRNDCAFSCTDAHHRPPSTPGRSMLQNHFNRSRGMDKCSESFNKAWVNVLYKSVLVSEFLPVDNRHFVSVPLLQELILPTTTDT